MKFKKVSDELSAFLDDSFGGFIIEKRKMFGCPVYFVNTNMFAGVFEDQIFLRLSEKDREEIKDEYDESQHFDPLGGKPMREYIVIPDQLYNNTAEFTIWLNRSYDYANSLPQTKKKSGKKKQK
ncbi:TfoX/Sxy family protein [candidate division KSB1 bacterium]